MENIIEVKQLMKSFGSKTALKHIEFNVRKGEIFGFLGPSGSGKTTTIKILTSQLTLSAGEVHVFGKDITRTKDFSHLNRIGILTDNSGLYERLSVYDNLELFCKLYDVPMKRIDEVLGEVNLLQDKKAPVKQLSKGMRQRVTLARALLHKPDLLFLDEPTSALDPTNTMHIHESLRKLNTAGTTIFLTTHDMSEAEQLCDRIAFIHEGEIRALDTPQNLRLMYSDRSITVVTAHQGKEIIVQDAAGIEKIQTYMQQGTLQSIHSNEPTLGDIFVKLTGGNLQ